MIVVFFKHVARSDIRAIQRKVDARFEAREGGRTAVPNREIEFCLGDTALANLTTKAPNQTLFMGEVGTSTSDGNGGVYYSNFNILMEWAKTRKLSWLNWSIANNEIDIASLSQKQTTADPISQNDPSSSRRVDQASLVCAGVDQLSIVVRFNG